MKKKVFWVFLWVMVLVGGLLISHYCFQTLPIVLDVNAQEYAGYNYSVGSSIGQVTSFGHPTDLMPTLFTCSGCAATQSTCDWNCGATFNNCSSGGGSSGSSSVGSRIGQGSIIGTYPTLLTCSGSLFGSCGGGGSVNTLMTCSSGLFGGCGGGGGMNTLMTCSGNLYGGCGGGSGMNSFLSWGSLDIRSYTMGSCSGRDTMRGCLQTMTGCLQTMGGCLQTMGGCGSTMGGCGWTRGGCAYNGGLGLMSNSAASPGF